MLSEAISIALRLRGGFTFTSSVAAAKGSEKATAGGGGGGGQERAAEMMEDPISEDAVNLATVFCIWLEHPRCNLIHEMNVPKLRWSVRYFWRCFSLG
ncbi:hypothetical protein U1Q18_010708 [Sarracenia purpurea var. burkii]